MRVAEEQCVRIDLGGRRGLRIGAEVDGVLDVQVERQLERKALADDDGILRRPRRGMGEHQRAVLRRQRLRGEPEIHAIGERLEPTLGIRIQRLPGRESGAIEPERARLHVAGECGLADQFGKPAAGRAAIEIHLEETRFCLRITLQEGDIVTVRGLDRRHAERVVIDRAGRGQPRRRDRLARCLRRQWHTKCTNGQCGKSCKIPALAGADCGHDPLLLVRRGRRSNARSTGIMRLPSHYSLAAAQHAPPASRLPLSPPLRTSLLAVSFPATA